MQDPKSQTTRCRACNAQPRHPCLTEDGAVAERVHWGRPEPYGAAAAPAWTDETWVAAHAGNCEAGTRACGAPARLYACGWRCHTHAPTDLAEIK